MKMLSKDLVSLKNIVKMKGKLNKKNCMNVLIDLWKILSDTQEIKDAEKDEFVEEISRLKEKLKSLVPQKYHFYLLENVKFAEENKKQKDLLQVFAESIIRTLLTHSKTEFSNGIEMLLNKSVQDRKVTSYNNIVTNSIYKIVEGDFDTRLVQRISFLLEEEDIGAFLNFVIKLDYRQKNQEEQVHRIEYKFLQALGRLFLHLKYANPVVYKKIVEYVHIEKRYFKEIVIRNLPDLNLDKILSLTRDYNFEVLASLFEDRPFLVDQVVSKFLNGELLIPRKVFLEKVFENDGFFARKILKLNLESFELVELCEKSELFMEEYFSQKAGNMALVCRIFSDRGEEYTIEFIERHSTHRNISLLINSMAKTVRLSGNLKDYLVENYAESREHFNALLPFVPEEKLEALVSKFYVKKETLSGLLRRFYPMDLLGELHKFSDYGMAHKLFEEALDNEKFADSDFIFLLKSLESSDFSNRFEICLLLLKHKKSIHKQCVIFLENAKEMPDDPIYIQCLELIDCIKVLERLNNVDCLEIVKNSKTIRNKLVLYFKKAKELNSKMKELKAMMKLV